MSDIPIKTEEKNNDNTIIQESEENANKDSKIVEEESIKQDDNDKKSATTATITTSGDTGTAKKNATVESGEDSDLDDDDIPELAEEQGAKVEDLNSQAQANAAQQFQNSAETTTAAATSKEIAKVEESIEEDSTAIDETNVEAKDIELVMQQTNCSRARAVKALKNNKNDIINAIMALQ
nr:1152_t:CDS:2 [Entrophospora candida]